ncbi:hypothetical protein LCGC14_3078290 [marine sediment metagenome]|uniref:Uncharacterized protein n=1 Tax=marine sediment metagenome TaxID=412755 RepID=A0A0F8YLM0_9ZZZZ
MSEAHEARISRNEEDIQDIWKVVEDIKKVLAARPPLWCTFLLMALSSGLTGFIVRAFS